MKSTCCVCEELKEVCCDSGHSSDENGEMIEDTSVDAYCIECCENNHGPAKTWPTYERMDCDQ